LAALGIVALSGMVVYAAGEPLPRSAVVSGGGIISDGGLTLRPAIGQPVAGTVSDGSTRLCSGVVCGPSRSGSSSRPSGALYLPVIPNE
jgi:hypothetical protein